MKKGGVINIHKQQIIYVRNPDRRRKRIVCDCGVVPLVRRLWDNGFETVFSCQGDDFNKSYIVVKDNGRMWEARDIVQDFWTGVPLAMSVTIHNHIAFESLNSDNAIQKWLAELKRQSVMKTVLVGENSCSEIYRRNHD
jgi:hypothetical protein